MILQIYPEEKWYLGELNEVWDSQIKERNKELCLFFLAGYWQPTQLSSLKADDVPLKFLTKYVRQNIKKIKTSVNFL